MEVLENKILDLEKWTSKTNNPEEIESSLNNMRKCGEAICKIIILNRHGETGKDIIDGKLKIDGTPTQKHVALNLSGLISSTCTSNQNHTIISDGKLRTKVETYLETIRIHSNPASHDSENPLTLDDFTLTRIALKSLTTLVFKEILNQNLPDKINNEYKIAQPSPHSYENMRAKDIISLIYPKNDKLIEIKQSDSSNKISYEYISVEIVNNIKIGYVFVNKNISIEKTLVHFIEKNDTDLYSLYICTPQVYKKSSEVNRVKSIENIIDRNESLIKIKVLQPSVFTVNDFVWRECLSNETKDKNQNIETDEYFVDQELFSKGDNEELKNLGFSLEYLSNILDKDNTTPIQIIAGGGGVGKTTFCEKIISKINKNDYKLALFISSADIKNKEPDHNIITVSDLYNFYAKAVGIEDSKILEKNNLEINISCGNIILIIDGLDEIESSLKEKFVLNDFITSAITLNNMYSKCNIIITTRDYNITRYDDFNEITINYLQGFDSKTADRYFKKRFTDDEDVKKAQKYLMDHDVGDREHYIPLYVSLICDAIDRKRFASLVNMGGINDSKYFNCNLFIDSLIFDVLQREILKQSLGISCDDYFEILSEIAVINDGFIKKKILDEFISIMFPKVSPSSNLAKDKYRQFYVCPLISKSNDDKFSISYDFLESWVKSRYLFSSVTRLHDNENTRKLFSEMYSGKSHLLKELVELGPPPVDSISIGKNIVKNIRDSINSETSNNNTRESNKQALSGTLYYLASLIPNRNKEKTTELLIGIYDGHSIDGLHVYGDFFPIDFTELTITNSTFDGFNNLHKCSFPANRAVFYYSTLKNIKTVNKQNFAENIFDVSCVLDSNFEQLVEANTESKHLLYDHCVDDLRNILKVGFRGGGFSWKSELIYRNVTFSGNFTLSQYLDFLCEKNILVKEKSNPGKIFGYIVAKEHRTSAKQLIANAKVTPEFDMVVSSMLQNFYKLEPILDTA